MKTLHQKLIQIFLFLFINLISSATYIYAASIGTDKEILFISSYDSETHFIHENLTNFAYNYKYLGGQYSAVIETLNCNSLGEADQWMHTLQDVLQKHPSPVLIVLLGAEAWYTYLSLTDDKYKEIPLFCAMSYRYGAKLPRSKDTPNLELVDFYEMMKGFNVQVCLNYEYDIEKNIELIKDLFPKTNNIALISDNTYNGISHLALVQQEMKKYPNLVFTSIDGSSINQTQAIKLLKKLPQNTAILLGVWRIDKENVTYMDNSVHSLAKIISKLPVFSFTSTGIGYWAIGGYIPVYSTVGGLLGEKAYNLLDNNLKKEPYFNCNQNEYKFDANKLKEFKINKDKLPSNSVIINKKVPFYERHRSLIITVIFIIITLIIGLFTTLYYYFRARTLNHNLEISEQKLLKEKELLINSEKKLIIAKEHAEEASKLKTAFVSNMSHEIRTPLNAIVGFSNLLATENLDKKDQKEYLEIISRNSDLLLQLINDILDISRLESGRLQFCFEDCDVVPYCQSILKTVEVTKRTNVQLHFSAPVDELYINTDMMRLQQVIINLLTNALKFTQEGSITLSFDVIKERNVVLFSITDTGCGIPEDKQSTVFDRFEKLNEFMQGTGLGLSICKLTVEKLGGDIWVDSLYKEGARFIFSHPIKRNGKTTDDEE